MQLHQLPEDFVVVVSYGEHNWRLTKFIVRIDGSTRRDKPPEDVKVALAASKMHHSLLVFCLNIGTRIWVVQQDLDALLMTLEDSVMEC